MAKMIAKENIQEDGKIIYAGQEFEIDDIRARALKSVADFIIEEKESNPVLDKSVKKSKTK